MNMNFKKLSMVTLLLCSLPIYANILHWLTQPRVDIGLVANAVSFAAKISSNGRYVVFFSHASNLVANDNNQAADLFLHDLQTGTISLVSTTATGNQLTSVSSFSAPTSDGRYIAFTSSSPLLPNPSPSAFSYYIYVKDMQTGAVINHSDYGSNFFSIRWTSDDLHLSDDGQFLTFSTDEQIDPLHSSGTDTQVYRKHLSSDSFEFISIAHDGLSGGNDDVELMGVSDNGHYVLMASKADNLTTDALNNTGENLYIRDTLTNTTTLVNKTPAGVSSSISHSIISNNEAAISNTGTVAFCSSQSDLVNNDNNNNRDVFYYDNGVISRISLDTNGNELPDSDPLYASISADGSRIAFSHGSDALFPAAGSGPYSDVYSYAVTSGELSLISQTATNTKGNQRSYDPLLSANGNRLVFLSRATDLNSAPVAVRGQVFSYNFISETIKTISSALFSPDTIIAHASTPLISSDQSVVVFSSQSPNFIAEPIGDESNDVFLLDRNTNGLTKIAAKAYVQDISPSGDYITMKSQYLQPDGISDLGSDHIFLFNRTSGSYTLIEEGFGSAVNNNGVVAFTSLKNIDSNDSNNSYDAYVYYPNSQTIDLISKESSGVAAGSDDWDIDIGGTGNNIWVSFSSENANIVASDSNGVSDIFIKKLPNSSITRVSATSAGVEVMDAVDKHTLSGDGKWMVFGMDATDAANFTTDDYSLAFERQLILFDRINHQFSLVSKNDAGMPVSAESTDSTTFFALNGISETGRYISYGYRDEVGAIDLSYANDDDGARDIVLFDTLTQTAKIISNFPNGTQATSDTDYSTRVAENNNISPPIVGVTFSSRGNRSDLTGIAHHPGAVSEGFLYQQGGPDLNLNITVQGTGSVVGVSGVNCSSNCQYQLPLGQEVTLTAIAGTGEQFVGWQLDFGQCNDDNNPCELVMDREKNLTAVFTNPVEIIFKDGFE